jgi:hypothetical protein
MTLSPVRPLPSHFNVIRLVTHKQVELMVGRKSCPTCLVGIVPHGNAICPQCEADVERECNELDYSELMATMKGRG